MGQTRKEKTQAIPPSSRPSRDQITIMTNAQFAMRPQSSLSHAKGAATSPRSISPFVSRPVRRPNALIEASVHRHSPA